MSLRRLSVSAGYMLLVTSTHSFGINATGLFIIVYVGFMCVVYGRLVVGVLYTSEGELGQSVASCRRCADLALFRLLGSHGFNGRISIFYCALQSSKIPFSIVIGLHSIMSISMAG